MKNKTNQKENFNKFIKELKKCQLCKDKFHFTPHPVVIGNIDSKIVQISQAPSKTVHETRKPFTDLSGKKLKYTWYQITDEVFYNENNFYITSLSHCYPGKDKKGNDKMPPKICYQKWLKKELEYINNEIYIIIGAKAAKVFFPKEDFTSLIMKDNYLNNKLTYVLPHPSPLNIKWFKDHPEFNNRIKEIRNKINDIIKKKESKIWNMKLKGKVSQ